ncbi:hypothetical protein IKQ_06107 [Bacillus cereus VDM053]|nr:hypothetical protein IKQ_06107 [Bacillus cereus VDM053]
MTFYYAMNIKTWDDMKLTNSYKSVSFNVVVVATYKRRHTITTKLTSLMLLKNR